jgi:LmbE family N-acetylglucosaminyl deacetylase
MMPLRLERVRDALVIAPHPDDETIGAYGLIRRLVRQRARVRVVIVTDGAGSHRGSARWPTARLVAERRRETLRAMARIGVPAGAVRFVGLPDGGTSALPASALRPLTRAIAQARGVDLLLSPARDDDHPDHRVTAQAATAFGRSTRHLEYLVWPNRRTRSRPATHVLRLGVLAEAKRGAIRRYFTQTGAIHDDPAGFTISRAELAAFSHPIERYREVAR